MGKDSIRRLFFRYATPGVMAMVFLSLQSIADGFIVGRLIGADALASVNIAMPVYAIVTAVAVVVSVGTQAQMGIHMGACRFNLAKRAFLSAAIGLSVFSICGTLFVNFYADKLALFLGADDHLLNDCVAYIHGIMPWMVGFAASYFFDYMLKIMGHPKYAMAVMVGTIVLNVVLSLIFVGLLDMGTLGAGMGTGISFTAGSLVSGCLFFVKFRENKPVYHAKGSFSFRTLGHIFYNGSSEGLTEIAFAITTYLFNITFMTYAGKEGVAAFTLLNYIIFVGISVALGVSNGVVPIISFNHGARLFDRVRKVIKAAVVTNMAFGVCFMLLLAFGGRSIITLFVNASDYAVVDLAAAGALIVSIAFLFNGFNIFVSSYFTAVDKAGISLVVASLRGLVLLSLGIILLPRIFGVSGVWMAIPVAELLTSIVAIVLLWRAMAAK